MIAPRTVIEGDRAAPDESPGAGVERWTVQHTRAEITKCTHRRANSPSPGAPWGADVTYKPVALPDLGRTLINRFTPLLTDQSDAISWLTDHLDTRPATSDCAGLPKLP